MRAPGISTLAIRTAKYSGRVVPENCIKGMEHAEQLRALIRSLVRQSGSRSYGTGEAPAPAVPLASGQKISDGPVRIRQLPEARRR